MNNLLRVNHHLEFCNPKGGLRDGNREVVNLYAVKVLNGNFDRVVEFAELNLTAENFSEQIVFEATQAQITFRQKITAAAGRVKDFYRGNFVLEGAELFLGLERRKFFAQVVKKKFVDNLVNVFKRGVMHSCIWYRQIWTNALEE